jgi:hypothetical protein
MKKGYPISAPKQTNLAAKSSVNGASPLSRNESSNCGKTGALLNWFSFCAHNQFSGALPPMRLNRPE